VFLLIKLLFLAMFKLPFLMLMAPFKLLAEVLEHSGHRRHHQHHSRRRTRQPLPRYQYQPRRHRHITWLPGLAGLTRWSRQVTQSAGQPGRTPVQRYLLTPAAVLAVMGAWVGLVYVWLLWWMLIPIVLCVELAA
jgi:hypothetical protein